MPFILKRFDIVENKHKKIQHFLTDSCGFNISTAQKLVSKSRVFDIDAKRYGMSQKVHGDFIDVAVFEGQTRGLKPLFQTKDFAFFDKPSGLMVHPSSKNTAYTLLDEIRYHFGEDANLGHRIDQETSGLVLITRNKYSDILLKDMFENKLYKKEYVAVVQGKLQKTINIDSPIKKDTNSSIGVKMCCSSDGKESLTVIEPISYDIVKNQTLVKAMPHTGRQHQIRVHLDFIGHTIVGDPIYGVDEKYADMYLNKVLSQEDRIKIIGNRRLLLHANKMEFKYNNLYYSINSKLSLV